MAQPCMGSGTKVRRINRSRVPCGSSMVCSDIRFPFSFYMKIELLLSKCKGEPAQSIVTAWRLRKRHEVCYIFHLLPGKPGMPASGNQSGTRKFADFVVDSRAG